MPKKSKWKKGKKERINTAKPYDFLKEIEDKQDKKLPEPMRKKAKKPTKLPKKKRTDDESYRPLQG